MTGMLAPFLAWSDHPQQPHCVAAAPCPSDSAVRAWSDGTGVGPRFQITP